MGLARKCCPITQLGCSSGPESSASWPLSSMPVIRIEDMQQSERLDRPLLGEYADHFFGYGTLSAKYWFIGIEEGGGKTYEEVAARLRVWHERGELELEDAGEFSAAVNLRSWIGPKPKLQRTWSRYIRFICGAEGSRPNNEWIRQYQLESLGRSGGDSCLMNLLPFPSRSLKHWNYAASSGLAHLESRKAAMSYYAPRRARHIRCRILENHPRVVLFAGMDTRYKAWWQTIAGVQFETRSVAGRPFDFGREGSTLFVVIQHPAARNTSNEYSQSVGEYVAGHVKA